MVLHDPGPIDAAPLHLEEVPQPIATEHEIVVRVEACGICRTDLHVIEGDLPPMRERVIPGHQVVGTVQSCGPAADRFKIGDRVGIAWLRHTCGRCLYCRGGKAWARAARGSLIESLCADLENSRRVDAHERKAARLQHGPVRSSSVPARGSPLPRVRPH